MLICGPFHLGRNTHSQTLLEKKGDAVINQKLGKNVPMFLVQKLNNTGPQFNCIDSQGR